MALSRIQTVRSGTTLVRPPGPKGALYANLGDRQFGMFDFDDGSPLDLLAIVKHSEHVAYTTGSMVVYQSNLYKARQPVTAGVFDPANWWNLSAGPVATGLTAPNSPRRDGDLWLDRNPAGGPQLKVWVAETGSYVTVGADRLALSGGTLTGMVSMPITPTAQDHLVRKKYVDDTLAAGYVAKISPYVFDRVQLGYGGSAVNPSLQFGITGTGLHMFTTSPYPRLVLGGVTVGQFPPAQVDDIEGLSLLTLYLAEDLFLPIGASSYSLQRVALTAAGSATTPALSIGTGTGFYRTSGGRLAAAQDGVFLGAFMNDETAELDEFIRRDYADGRYLRSGLASYTLNRIQLERGEQNPPALRFEGTNTGLHWGTASGQLPRLCVSGQDVAEWPPISENDQTGLSLLTRSRADARYQPIGDGVAIGTGRVFTSGDIGTHTGVVTGASRISTGRYRINGDFNPYLCVVATLWGGTPEGKSLTVTEVADNYFEVEICTESGAMLNHAFQFVVF